MAIRAPEVSAAAEGRRAAVAPVASTPPPTSSARRWRRRAQIRLQNQWLPLSVRKTSASPARIRSRCAAVVRGTMTRSSRPPTESTATAAKTAVVATISESVLYRRLLVSQVVLAFECLHGKDVLYRDLKPENLVLDATGYVKVVDFGLSKVLTGFKTWTMCGTPEYLAPEILRNEGHNHNVDFWMLGVLTFELAHGQGPFVASDEMALFELILKMRPKFPRSFSKHLRDLVSRLLTHQKKRLGNSKEGWGTVKKHMWFAGYDWDGIVTKHVTPPLKPSATLPRATEATTLAECEAPDAKPCPEWRPDLPQTLHKWRPSGRDNLAAAASSRRSNPTA